MSGKVIWDEQLAYPHPVNRLDSEPTVKIGCICSDCILHQVAEIDNTSTARHKLWLWWNHEHTAQSPNCEGQLKMITLPLENE